MKSTILALLAFASMSAMAATATPSQSEEQFCADRDSSSYTKDLTKSYTNLMAFQNRGGLANGGVCWWHSRFQRNALYLTIYKPAEKKPTISEAEKLISKIRSGKDIIEIPGFSNFNEFSGAYRSLIQRELEKWQKSDGIVKFNWVIGLSGSNEVEAPKLKEMMDELYDYVEVQGNIAYQKLQIKGVTAHAWLVVNMKQVDGGYDLEIIDSNFQHQTTIYKYRDGMTSFNHYYYGNFVPYLERKGEMDQLSMAILKKCKPEEYKERKKKETANNNSNNEYSGS
nr:hypothetical protein BHI3_03620 [Bacteriovorax sp. HI3]